MAKMTEAKRAANKKWDAANHTKLSVGLPKELVARFKEKCKSEGISQAGFIREAIENFLGDN